MNVDERLTAQSAMKNDWDSRARENARWYINTLSLEQSEEEFDLSGRREFEGLIIPDLAILTDRRDPKSLRILEIGCGIGRITRYLAEIFGEVQATDVSGEMIRQARERLSDKSNVHCRETNGVDFSDFPDESFDVIFAAYVFQHVPSVEAIVSNICDAFRVLKPAGVFKFVTSGIHSEEFDQTPKDTWSGAPFPENAVRHLAQEIGAQLLGTYGDGTQYCWTLMRKRSRLATEASSELEIISIGRAEDLNNPDLTPLLGNAYLGLIVGGVDYEKADVTNLLVDFRGNNIAPYYVGPTAVDPAAIIQHKPFSFNREQIQVSVRIPANEPSGEADLCIKLIDGPSSPPAKIYLPPAQTAIPAISFAINTVDNGTDIHARGPKSRMKVLFTHFGEEALAESAMVLVNEVLITPEGNRYLSANGLWESTLQLPENVGPGPANLRVQTGQQNSLPFAIDIKD
jgi:SAM-dependent methyltransferase